jgi:anti-sigma B factor antagonist
MKFALATQRWDEDTFVVSASGEIDLCTAPEFERELLEAFECGAVGVVVDLRGTTFLDSSGLNVLSRGQKLLRTRGGQICVVCTNANVKKVFEITGLNRLCPIYASFEEAIECCRAPAVAA